ncbi:MAG: bacteriochlorophyll 4-vinyl reductase [Pseudomonadota bacterium]|jgi:divinyl protochlorophyllide a 8-vinyl-reductase
MRLPLSPDSDRIGPNAITQVIAALEDRVGLATTRSCFEAAGLICYLDAPPETMVSERHVAMLQATLREVLGPALAHAVSRDAGTRTGDYLLANRIPKAAQRVLRWLPAQWAARILARAITRHAWTFAGTGQFSFKPGFPFVFEIQHNPLCRMICAEESVCDFYTATFERIFSVLVHPSARVVETACESAGARACVFEIVW